MIRNSSFPIGWGRVSATMSCVFRSKPYDSRARTCKCQRPSSSALCVVRTVMSVVPLCVCVQICGSLSLQTLVQNVPRCDVMCCDVQCCAVLCCVVFRRAVCNQIVILRFVETHRRPPADVQMQLDELPKASRDLLCSPCFPGGKARRHNGTKA